MNIDIGTKVNGRNVKESIEPRMTLADFLRQRCGVASVRTGCEQGACGTCTVELDGMTARSCLTLAATADGSDVTTVEGISPIGELTPLQEQLWRHHGLQCGFCTSGIIMVMREFLRENPDPTHQEVREALSGNICRCTGYQNIVDSVLAAVQVEREGE